MMTEVIMKEIIKMEQEKAKENMYGKMEHVMKENGKTE